VAAPRPRVRRKRVGGVSVQALARRETPSRDLCPFVRGLKPRRGEARGPLVEAPLGESPFPWGKIFDVNILTFRCLCIFSGNGFSYACSSLLRLKRMLEQAQPSMAKRLKVGAASKVSG